MARTAMPIPPVAALVGVALFAQGAALDPMSPAGFALTDGLQLRLGR